MIYKKMNQEELFMKYYEGLDPADIADEITTLGNIRLSVDFYEYIATDPEKLLAIIHFNNLEDRYGIRVVFDTDEDEMPNTTGLTNNTGNMAILFNFNDDVYRISTMVDTVSNNTVFDSFTEQILFLLNNHKSNIISKEEDTLRKYEKDIRDKYHISTNLMWYICNTPSNIKELLMKVENAIENKEFVNTPMSPVTPDNDNDNEVEQEIKEDNTKDYICPMMTATIAICAALILKVLVITTQV